jgi:hypothetical protein
MCNSGDITGANIVSFWKEELRGARDCILELPTR